MEDLLWKAIIGIKDSSSLANAYVALDALHKEGKLDQVQVAEVKKIFKEALQDKGWLDHVNDVVDTEDKVTAQDIRDIVNKGKISS